MQSIAINDIKNFMSDLLVKDVFDEFHVTEVSITTFNTFTIDGHVNKGFYSESDTIPEEDISYWRTLKPICFDLIKGKNTPIKFRIVFMKRPDENDSIDALFANIKYEAGSLNCVTGASMKSFTMDKSLENEWDDQIQKLLQKYS